MFTARQYPSAWVKSCTGSHCVGDYMVLIELLAKLDKTVAPAEAGVQKSLKNLVPGLRRDDEKGLLQEAQ